MAQVDIKPAKFGQGIFAAEPIPAGTILFTISGPIIDFATAVQRDAIICHTIQVGLGSYIDLADQSIGLTNHSCSPNCGFHGLDLVPLRDLTPGEEILWDYSTSMDEDSWTMACLCGSPNCRGVIKDFRLLPPALQQHYLALGIVLPFIAEQYQ